MTKSQKQYKLLIKSDLRVVESLKSSDVKSDRLIAAYLIRECDDHKLSIEVPGLIRKNADIYTGWEADCRYYPEKIIRRDSLNRAYEAVSEWLESGDTGK